jgi:hypothetical protein
VVLAFLGATLCHGRGLEPGHYAPPLVLPRWFLPQDWSSPASRLPFLALNGEVYVGSGSLGVVVLLWS